jgi:high-affinity iron transporter
MLTGFLLSLREGLEIALVIGIVIGALRKMQRAELIPIVWLGAGSAAILCLIAAALLTWVGGKLEGRAEQLFEGFAMLAAAALLTWMIFWLHGHARTMREKLETDVRRSVIIPGKMAMFGLAFLAVGREGLELALFLIAARVASDTLGTLSGAVLGLAAAAMMGWMIFSGTRRLSLSSFFRVTNVVLIIVAAGLVAHGVHELNEAGLIPAIIDPVWDINYIFDESSLLGEFMKTLVGYNGNPSLTEVLATMGYFLLVFLGMRRITTTQLAVPNNP